MEKLKNNYDFDNETIFLHGKNGDVTSSIKISDFEAWLAKKDYITPRNDESSFTDFEYFESENNPIDVIKFIQEYFKEQN